MRHLLLRRGRYPADSGIDSDTGSEGRNRGLALLNEESDESDATVEFDVPMDPVRRTCPPPRPIRGSPPLFEVELTASDDDDASMNVLTNWNEDRLSKILHATEEVEQPTRVRYIRTFSERSVSPSLCEVSSDEDDASVNLLTNRNESRLWKILHATEEIEEPPIVTYIRTFPERSIRSTPPLFKVSSDEDDASVREPIIPHQRPRNKKLPTLSPLKTTTKASKCLCGLRCCFRKEGGPDLPDQSY